MYQPEVNKSDCNLAPMSLLTRSGSTVPDHTDSLCVIHASAPMQAKIDAQSCGICARKNGSFNLIGLFSPTLFRKMFNI